MLSSVNQFSVNITCPGRMVSSDHWACSNHAFKRQLQVNVAAVQYHMYYKEV